MKVDVIIFFMLMIFWFLIVFKQWFFKILWLDYFDCFVFEDLFKEKVVYVLFEYQDFDLFIFRDYGMKYLFWVDFILRVKVDFRSCFLKMKSFQMDVKWYLLVVKFLKRGLRNFKYEEEIKVLNFLLFFDGSWISVIKGGSVYFFMIIEGFLILVELGFKFIKVDVVV